MIYRHYKGGLYFNIGYATRFSSEFPAKSIEQVAIASLTENEHLKKCAVLIVRDKLTGSWHYAIDDDLEGVYCLYKDVYGTFWLRPKEMFFAAVEIIENGTAKVVPRFKKLSGEELFNYIIDSFRNNLEYKI